MDTYKLTFLGDITCDRPLLNASRKNIGEYDFSKIFEEVKDLLNESDYVIGNFETVCAGSNRDYNSEYLLYNSPDQMVMDMRNGGIDFVTTANNHCLDQGINGLKRTIEVLEKYGINHTGTFLDRRSRNNLKVINIGSIKIVVLSYTYSTNESNTGIVLNHENDFYVGLLREQRKGIDNLTGLKGFISSGLSAKHKRQIKRAISRIKLRLGKSYFKSYIDTIQENDTNNKYISDIAEEIAEAKKIADIVIVCPHMGGQFNEQPGRYSEFIVDYLLECGADIIAGNHPHVAQKIIRREAGIAAFSLGSFNLSTSADYIIQAPLPEYSIGLHVYIDSQSKHISKTTFSILKIVEDDSHNITVFPVHKLYKCMTESQKIIEKEKIIDIYNRITEKNIKEITLMKEYDI